MLVDPSIESAQKAKLIGSDLRQARCGCHEPARCAGLVALVNSDQLVDGIEQIGIRAIAASADDATIEDQLFDFARIVTADHELELAVGSALSDPEQKAELVDRLLGGKADAGTPRDSAPPRAERTR